MLLLLQKKIEANITLVIILLYTIPLLIVLGLAIYRRIIYPIRQNLKKKNPYGYILTSQGNYEHREIIEKLIKRRLQPGEEVHHINGIKWDNRKSNLALMTREEHLRWHKKLEWMWSQNYKTPMRWQKRQLVEQFGARLF